MNRFINQNILKKEIEKIFKFYSILFIQIINHFLENLKSES